MLAGEAVVAIWNGLADGALDNFYDWHMNEHMSERVAIPGFLRGRRYVADDAATQPQFFTLYELQTLEVARGPDYANRLNAPTPWTTRSTAQFRDTIRSLSQVMDSHGPGRGGGLVTLRFDIADAAALGPLLAGAMATPRMAGAHLCRADRAASVVRTTETQGRADIKDPPAWFILLEATDPQAAAAALPDAALLAAGARDVVRGCYRLEYIRGKTAWS